MSQLAQLFKLNRQQFNLPRGLYIFAVLLVPLVVLGVVHQDRYWISVSFAALFVGLSDPGGDYGYRVREMAGVAVIGASLTALGFGVGAEAWGFAVLAAFAVTLLGGLAVKFGLHRFVAGLLLNAWFVVALALPGAYRLDRVHTSAGAQTLAWLAGSALWIAFTCIMWLARGRTAQAEPVAEIPGDTSPVKLTRPLILFAVIRAVALAVAVAIAFGLQLADATWMPIATLVAMKPSLRQSALAAEQRLAGAILGAAVAALFLLTVDTKTVLEVVIVILGALAGAIRTVNYTLYCAVVAGFVLIAMDLPHPSNLAAEGRRVLFTLAGVGIAVVVMVLANLLQKRTAKPAPAT